MTPLGGWQFLVVCLGLPASVGANRKLAKGVSSTAHAGHERIVPELSPKSDSHFFGHDYPDDFKPRVPVDTDFKYPYPVVQKSDAFDKDYVKDENSDRGEWKAQMDYDRLRTRMKKLKADETKILKKKEELEKELDAQRAKKKQLEQEAKKSEEEHRKAEEDAEGQAEKAQSKKGQFRPARANESAEDDANFSTAVGVFNASGKVKKELSDIEDCKKKLAEARAQLKKLHEEMERAAKTEEESVSAKEAALKREEASRAKEAEAAAALKAAEAKHEEALGSYEKEAQELHGLEGDLSKAEARLRKYRPGDKGAGAEARGAAGPRAPPLWAAPLACLAAWSLSRG